METFGERLRVARKRTGVSQALLANRIGLHRSQIARFETDISLPSLPSILKIVQELHVSADYLLGVTSSELWRGGV